MTAPDFFWQSVAAPAAEPAPTRPATAAARTEREPSEGAFMAEGIGAFADELESRPADRIEFATFGKPELLVRATQGRLFALDPKAFAKIKGDDMQTCAEMVLSMAYPPRLIVVRKADGGWQSAY